MQKKLVGKLYIITGSVLTSSCFLIRTWFLTGYSTTAWMSLLQQIFRYREPFDTLEQIAHAEKLPWPHARFGLCWLRLGALQEAKAAGLDMATSSSASVDNGRQSSLEDSRTLTQLPNPAHSTGATVDFLQAYSRVMNQQPELSTVERVSDQGTGHGITGPYVWTSKTNKSSLESSLPCEHPQRGIIRIRKNKHH